MARTFAIDVSHHQKARFLPWQDLYDAGYGLCIARACYGTRKDSEFYRHLEAARKVGMATGAYCFFRQGEEAEPQFKAMDQQIRLVGGIDVYPTIDLEWQFEAKTNWDRFDKAGIELCRRTIAKYGGCIGYTGLAFLKEWRRFGSRAQVFEQLVQWIAAYRPDPPDVRWDVWQHEGEKGIPGIYEPPLDQNIVVDLDVLRPSKSSPPAVDGVLQLSENVLGNLTLELNALVVSAEATHPEGPVAETRGFAVALEQASKEAARLRAAWMDSPAPIP